MTAFRFSNVSIEAYTLHLPPHKVSSSEIEDRIAPLYDRLKIPHGTLEKLSGVQNRHFWDRGTFPSQVATAAAEDALSRVKFDLANIGAVINCSVTRDFFEPSTASLVQGNLKLPETAISFDITNACIGFSNGISILGNMIESGAVKAGILVSGETVSRIVDASISRMIEEESLTRDQLLKLLPTLTLGSGAVAMVMCHSSLASTSHKVVGSVARSATEHNDLCEGNGDYCIGSTGYGEPLMYTESSKIIPSAAILGGRTWREASEQFKWTKDDVDHIYCHQVGKQVNEAFYSTMDLDMEKEFTVYQQYGNLVSAALPSGLFTGAKEKGMKAGENVLLTAFGSGLHAIFTGIVW